MRRAAGGRITVEAVPFEDPEVARARVVPTTLFADGGRHPRCRNGLLLGRNGLEEGQVLIERDGIVKGSLLGRLDCIGVGRDLRNLPRLVSTTSTCR